ncbi:hypothetical protein [Orenia marismortui]|uniref:Uncharacterized protein n=1 Tax=Orenia marismortui TaxID=46469 RepID=A0A4R8GZW8_9FIRM|nr:hypothetical protein [Orenia marismortui]TDX52317.1 hypothetical protein C7959_10724 [Orenia marismortui]
MSFDINSTNNYDEIMDQQFNLLQDMINLSDYVIYQEYEDLELLETGMDLLKKMIKVNKLNYHLVDNFAEEREVKFIKRQYHSYSLDLLDKIGEEIRNLQIILEDISEVYNNFDSIDEDLKIEAMNTIETIATYNLRDYENTIKNTFKGSL